MVLIVERGIPPKERLRQQDLYAERMSTGVKALTLKQSMSVSKKNFFFCFEDEMSDSNTQIFNDTA